MTTQAVLVALSVVAGLAQQAVAPSGQVSGVVVNAVSGEPVRGARVKLEFVDRLSTASGSGRDGSPSGGSQTVRTGDDGSFAVAGVGDGVYVLMAERVGFLRAFYGARRPGGAGYRLRLSSGESLDGVRIGMFSQAVVSGSVVDVDGEPAEGAAVQLFAVPDPHSFTGGRLGPPLAVAHADDRGQFRLIVSASPGPAFLMVSPSPIGAVPPRKPGEPRTAYVPIYYPDAVEASEAATIEVQAGRETNIGELKLRPVRVFDLTGSVVGPDGREPASYSVELLDGRYGMLLAMAQPLRGGGFRAGPMAAGSYVLVARTAGPRQDGVGVQEVEVGPATGRVAVIAGTPASPVVRLVKSGAKDVDVSRATVTLRSGLPVLAPPRQPDKSGAVEFRGVPPGSYRVKISGVRGGYVESISFGGVDALLNEITIASGPQTITATVRGDGGTVNGSLDVPGGPALAGLVCLLPRDSKLRGAGLAWWVVPDQTGTFTITDVRPGAYAALFTDEPSCGKWTDDAEFRKVEGQAVDVEVSASQREEIKVAAN